MNGGPVLVTGASGLLGSLLLRSVPDGIDAVAVRFRHDVADVASVHADLRNSAATLAAIQAVRPSLIIHAAYALDEASIVDATANVVKAAAAIDAAVLMISTDAVFCGDGSMRDEQAVPDAAWNYGRHKAAAERLVVNASGAGATVVRLPLLVSVEPPDHVVRQLRAAQSEGTVTRWYTDEIRQPVRASEAAAAIWRIAALQASERGGVWHLAGAERLSRFDIACRMVDELGFGRSAIEPSTQPPGTDRPRDIAFSDTRARTQIGWFPSPIP